MLENANPTSRHISMLEMSVSKTLYYLWRLFSVFGTLIQNTNPARVKTLFKSLQLQAGDVKYAT